MFSETMDLSGFLEGALHSFLGCSVGFLAWWIMFRALLGRRVFRSSQVVAAPAASVWDSLFTAPSPAGGWRGGQEIAEQGFEGASPTRHCIAARHGDMAPLEESAWRVLRLEPQRFFEGELESRGGAPVGPGEACRKLVRLTQSAEGILVEQEVHRLVRGVFGHLYLHRADRRFLDHLRAHCEGAIDTQRMAVVSRWASLALSVVAFAVVALFLGGFDPAVWTMAAFVATFLQAAVWLHEYGHLVGMRWFGHREATLMLVPLVGGAVVNARPSRSCFETATVALMGPALSGAAVLGLAPLAPWGLRYFADPSVRPGVEDWSDPQALATWAGLSAVTFLAMAIPLNLYNLAPVGMLDGGRVVSALTQGRVARALLASAIFAALAFALAGSAGAREFGAALAFVVVVWIVSLLAAEKGPEAAAPMNWMERWATLALLVVTLTIYVEASRWLAPAFFSALQSGFQESLSTARDGAPLALHRGGDDVQTAGP